MDEDAVAEKLKISSTSYGDAKLHRFEFRAKEMLAEIEDDKRRGIVRQATDVINRHTTIGSIEIDVREHYSMVELVNVDRRYPELLDYRYLREYIGDIAPVGFAPDFLYGQRISERLSQNVPDYSPKNIYIAAPKGERLRIYKPYTDQTGMAEPDFIELTDPQDRKTVLGYCWFAPKGEQMLGKWKPSGRLFKVNADEAKERARLAGVVYKSFGFSIGDRTLPVRTLWTKTFPRALWFTGEIHVIDKKIIPTTDRSNFVDNIERKRFYTAAETIPNILIRRAEQISHNRKAHDDSARFKSRLLEHERRLRQGQVERAEVRPIKEEIADIMQQLKARGIKCKDGDILTFQREVLGLASRIQKEIEDAKFVRGDNPVADLPADLGMTTKARKVYDIIMRVLEEQLSDNKDEYYSLAREISKALRRRYV